MHIAAVISQTIWLSSSGAASLLNVTVMTGIDLISHVTHWHLFGILPEREASLLPTHTPGQLSPVIATVGIAM
jgi:hypothetical protein